MFLSILGDNCGLNTLDAMVVTNDWLCYVCADYIKYDNVPHGSPKERQDVRVTLVPLARASLENHAVIWAQVPRCRASPAAC